MPTQRDVCCELCEQFGYEIIVERSDPGKSGTHDERPEFQLFKRDIRERHEDIDVLVAYSCDRFMRNATLATAWVDELVDLKINLHTEEDGFLDLDNPSTWQNAINLLVAGAASRRSCRSG